MDLPGGFCVFPGRPSCQPGRSRRVAVPPTAVPLQGVRGRSPRRERAKPASRRRGFEMKGDVECRRAYEAGTDARRKLPGAAWMRARGRPPRVAAGRYAGRRATARAAARARPVARRRGHAERAAGATARKQRGRDRTGRDTCRARGPFSPAASMDASDRIQGTFGGGHACHLRAALGTGGDPRGSRLPAGCRSDGRDLRGLPSGDGGEVEELRRPCV